MTPLPAHPAPVPSGDGLRFSLDLSADSVVFDGHFPGTPMLPAVAQVDWAIRLAREHLSLPPRVSGLRSLKFLRVIQAPARLALDLSPTRDGRGVEFAYSHAGAACSQGRIEFSDDAARTDRPLL
ncbi:MAG TPA: hypothetical protein VMF52_04900 [Steroidobacteraceae bacterium]|nr:hypothetical protein [Steroidobacteraceae bacterium]